MVAVGFVALMSWGYTVYRRSAEYALKARAYEHEAGTHRINYWNLTVRYQRHGSARPIPDWCLVKQAYHV